MLNIITKRFSINVLKLIIVVITVICVLLYSLLKQGYAAENKVSSKSFNDSLLFFENRLSFRHRFSGSNKDSDLYNYWYVWGNNYNEGTTDFYFSGLYHKDINKTVYSYAENAFVESNDLKSEFEIYQLYGDIHTKDKLYGIRLGRQYIDWNRGTYIDGGLFKLFNRKPVEFQVFYGKPVSFYGENDGDWTAGSALTVKPWRSNRSRLDFISYYDKEFDKHDNRISLNTWQYWQEKNIATHGRLRFLNGRYIDSSIDINYNNWMRKLNLSMMLRHGAKLEETTSFNSPLFPIYGTREPYILIGGRVDWLPLSNLSVSTGATWRKVTDSENLGSNRDYKHYDLSFTYSPSRVWDISLSGEKWDVTNGDNFYGITGQIAYRNDPWKISVGSSYSVYKYRRLIDISPFVSEAAVLDAKEVIGEFSPDTQVFFSSIRYRWNDHMDFRVKGEMENNSEMDDNTYMVFAEIIFRFDIPGLDGTRPKNKQEINDKKVQ